MPILLGHATKLIMENLQKLPLGDQAFAKSLCSQYQQNLHLSDKQVYWVEKFYAVVQAPPPLTPSLFEQREAKIAAALPNAIPNRVDLSRILAMFDAAEQHIKYPRILLAVGEEVYQLARAGSQSSMPGSVNVTSKGSFGNRTWFGRIASDGYWLPARQFLDDRELFNTLVELAKNPEESARLYGQRFGHCCFCRRELTNHESIRLGYGPICAANYGL